MSVQRTQLIIHRFDTRHALWPECRMIRKRVFIDEQQVPVALEWDASDATAMHFLVMVDGQPAACARVLEDGHIGRMAVLPEWRGQGIGEALLLQAIQECRHLQALYARLSAQTQAVKFYERAGFVVCSEPYLDANIMHVDMQLELV
ncbi:GNAT family N-acetyltransferase [Methylophilus sp. Leaf408]|uniref:GNAT family N-acetyltransferase n=1 Tax=Methylophilus sp. Leaf408 TaxID=2876561 RepID=UPI001E4A8061|nr:GNAT family N-acetyltransferase [Methylophilus sp. Leaf408]